EFAGSVQDLPWLIKRTEEAFKIVSLWNSSTATKTEIQQLRNRFSRLKPANATENFAKTSKDISEALNIHKAIIALSLKLNVIAPRTIQTLCYGEIGDQLQQMIDLLKKVEQEGEFNKNERDYLSLVKKCQTTLDELRKAILGTGDKNTKQTKFSGALKSYNTLVERLNNRTNPSDNWAELLNLLKKKEENAGEVFGLIPGTSTAAAKPSAATAKPATAAAKPAAPKKKAAANANVKKTVKAN
ncbi:MAG: hypothetical protein LBJ71_02635, partial [Holosporaceae bacterium]|nr:hypothetical protein [Holosporaceae bacterium]